MSSQRETAITNLLTLITGAYAWVTSPSRRLRTFDDTPRTSRPTAFLFEGGNDRYTSRQAGLPKRVMECKLFIYLDTSNPATIGATAINTMIEAIEAAIKPQGMDAAQGKQTLGGTVIDCQINGTAFKDPGDLDGDGMIILPFVITLP